MNPLNLYNYVPTTVQGNQFLSFNQPGYYMTDYRNSSDLYSYIISQAPGGIVEGNNVRQYLQDNSTSLMNKFMSTTAKQFIGMETPGAPNTCSGNEQGVIYSGGKPLVNSLGQEQQFSQQCNVPGQQCMMYWDNTYLPQQGPHCMAPPKNAPPFGLLR